MSCLVVEKVNFVDGLKNFCSGIKYLTTFYNNETLTDSELTNCIVDLRNSGIIVERLFENGETIGFKCYVEMGYFIDKESEDIVRMIYDKISKINIMEAK